MILNHPLRVAIEAKRGIVNDLFIIQKLDILRSMTVSVAASGQTIPNAGIAGIG
ncbi:hypothetical protein BMS3Bbin04_01887 [bacterium BMS3Bbin04]|nr:hypothetical protein BMS3Bbin04_01887 [bacterium BMS3Bbin04]